MNELIIATDESTVLDAELVKRFKILVIPREAKRGRTRLSVSAARVIETGGLPTLLPVRVQAFAEYLRKFTHTQIVSIHAPQLIDEAAHYARLAAAMVAPQTQVQVYESKLFHSGLALLVETAARFVSDNAGTVTAEQVMVLLRRLEEHISSLLFVKGLGKLPCEPPFSLSQTISCLFGGWVPIQYQPGEKIFRQLALAQVEQLFANDKTHELSAEWYRSSLRQRQRRQTYATLIARTPHIRFSEIHIKNPALPKDFIQVTTYPSPAQIATTIEWIRRWSTLEQTVAAIEEINQYA